MNNHRMTSTLQWTLTGNPAIRPSGIASRTLKTSKVVEARRFDFPPLARKRATPQPPLGSLDLPLAANRPAREASENRRTRLQKMWAAGISVLAVGPGAAPLKSELAHTADAAAAERGVG